MAAMSAATLLKLDSGQFESTIKDMSVKRLMETIGHLQKEMSREQENFNSLSAELGSLKKSSGQYKSVSKDLTASQARLTLLMDRSMKCFSQQGNQQSKANIERRNSFKGSKSTIDVQSKKSTEPVNSKPNSQSTKIDIKPVQSGQATTTTKSKPDIQVQSMPASSSFSDLRSRFNNAHNGAPTNGNNDKTNVSSSIARSQSSVAYDSSKRHSDNVSNSVKTNGTKPPPKPNTDKVVTNGSKTTTNLAFKPFSNGSDNNISQSETSEKSSNLLASPQNKFLSKSTDNVFSQNKDSRTNTSEVVQGLKPSKPRTMVVMNSDKQMMDLDSFTDRKNLLGELKSFNKELKPVKTKKLEDAECHEVKLKTNSERTNPENKVNASQAPRGGLLGEIKVGKKLAEVKPVQSNNKSAEQVKHLHSTANEQSVNKTKTENNTATKTAELQAGLFDDLLKDVGSEDNSDKSSENSPRETTHPVLQAMKDNSGNAVSSEVTLDKRGASSNKNYFNDDDDGNDDVDDDSAEEVDDEDRFVTEFSFGQQPQTAQNVPKPAQEKQKYEPSEQSIPVIKNINKPKPDRPIAKDIFNHVKTDVEQKQAVVAKETSSSSHSNNTNNNAKQTQPAQAHGQPVALVTPSGHGNQVGNHGNNADFNEAGEELVKQTRANFMDWDPAKLLAELYKVKMMSDNIEDISHKFIGMEGLMEKLPMNKKKATLLKTWKRRFFKAQDGWLHYYETSNRDKPSDSLQLMGGKVEELGPRVLGVDDGRGKYLMVRVPTDHEYGQWRVALESQTADNVKATYVRPAPASTPHPKKKVIIIDIGSSAVRAGILGERPTLPHVFFPTVVAVNKQTGEIIVGADAFRPVVRKMSNIIHPIRPTNKVDKFNIDMDVMRAVLTKVFTDLKVEPKLYMVMLSTPQNLGDRLKEGLMKILVEQLHVRGVCMVQQSLLALYSYNAMSGIIVDIGERLEILPIYDGLLIEGGLSRQAYGGTKIQDSLYISLLEHRYQLNSPVEKWLVRYITEKLCYVTDNYTENKKKCDTDPASYVRSVDLKDYFLPEGAHQSVSLDHACFKSPEGFFNTDLWEMDYKNLQKQIYAAIQQCPMDSRKQMYRSVYLSGGVTMIPGFAERLQIELTKLAPPAAIVEVHASPQRYHAAYIGACAVASMDVFEMSCVSADEWTKMGVKACRKWGTS